LTKLQRDNYLAAWNEVIKLGYPCQKYYVKLGRLSRLYTATSANFQCNTSVYYTLEQIGAPKKFSSYNEYLKHWVTRFNLGEPVYVFTESPISGRKAFYRVKNLYPITEEECDGSLIFSDFGEDSYKVSVVYNTALEKIRIKPYNKGEKIMPIQEDNVQCCGVVEECVEKQSTDYENRTKFIGAVYNQDERLLTFLPFTNKKKVKEFLQRVDNAGKTVVLYKYDKELAVQLPIVEIDNNKEL